MANINFFYPRPQKGAALGPERRRRQHRRRRASSSACRSSSAVPGSSGWSGQRAVGSTCSAPATCTPRWPSSRRSRRTSSWTTCTRRHVQRRASSCGRAQAAHLDHVVPLHRHLRLVHRLLRRDAAADQAQLLGPRRRHRSAPASTSPTSRSSAPLVGSVTRPFGGWLADKYGGARVTLGTFAGMVVFTLAVLVTLAQLTPNPTADPAIASDNQSLVPVVPRLLPAASSPRPASATARRTG